MAFDSLQPFGRIQTNAGFTYYLQGGTVYDSFFNVFTGSLNEFLENVITANDVILPTAEHTGLKVGNSLSSKFGWRDLLGAISNDVSGGPPILPFRGGAFKGYSFSAAGNISLVYHMPHDWASGTDIFIHAHWGHNGTAISGNLVLTFSSTVAKGFNQVDFPAEISTVLTVPTPDIATVPRYRHRTDEIQLSSSTPSANQLNTANIEVDSLILVNIAATTIPTITGGTPNNPFIFAVDIHYQSTGMGTANKAPSFYI